jgi:F-type H+-transporting ATPase subunit b
MAETETTAHAPTVEDAAEHAATAVTSGGVAHTEAAAEHSAGGLPQFEFQHWGGQIGYLLILFALLYILMSRVFAPRIRRVFDERRSAIEGALASARAVQAEASAQADAARQALAEARGKAQKTAVDAKAKANAEAAARHATVEAELQAKLSQAEASIRASRDQAMGHVREIAADTAEALVEKLTGAKPSEEAVSTALASVKG